MNPSLSSHDIITGLPVAAFTVDANGIITQVNEALESLTGKTSQSVIGKKSWVLFHDKKQMTAVDEAINQGSAVNNKVSLAKGNQNPVAVELSVNPLIDAQGEVKGAIGLIKPEDNTLVRLNSAVNGSSSPMMMVDRDLKITFANPATMNMLRKNLETFKKVFPGFDLEGVLGSSIDRFHKNPAHQRTLLGDPKNLPYRAEIQVGPLTFDLNVSAMRDASGQYIGNTLEWHDISEAKHAQLRNQDYEGLANAVSKSQAIIEFNLDGSIITANENFLSVMGYTLRDLQGQHHRLFVEPTYAQSVEYRLFWEKLGKGEYDAGEYKRFGKGGKEIWIHGSYNPILDLAGRPYKVIKYATEITKTKLKNADYQGQLSAISKSQAVIEFNLDGTIITANENFLKTVGYSLAEIQGKHHRLFVVLSHFEWVTFRLQKLG